MKIRRGSLQMILFVWILFSYIDISTADDSNNSFFNFRHITLENFNSARRLLAGGDFRKLFNLIEAIIPRTLFNPNVLGPSSNMYQLKWSRQLEQIGFEYMKEDNSKRESNPLATIEYKDHIGFYWMGSVIKLLTSVFGKAIPESAFKEALTDFLEILEALVIFLWLAVKAPKTLPIKEGELFGAAEAMFGERYEIGCFTELTYSVCFLKRLPYRENMFKTGVPCTSCPTHCEYWSQSDGTIEEGELCIPPKEPQMNYVAANMTLTDATNIKSSSLAVALSLICMTVYSQR